MGRRIIGFAIISQDGMLADKAGFMPQALKIEADQRFFEQGLDAVDVVVHGRNSHEHQTNSPLRRRLIVTARVPALETDAADNRIVRWNPAGASFEAALAQFGLKDGVIGVIGGTEVFGMFLDRYDLFHLSRAYGVTLPGGRPVFPGVPAMTPEEKLTAHGMTRGATVFTDARLEIVTWERV